MHFDKLVTVLQSLDTARLKRLSKYIHSAYFGVYAPSVSLFDYLILEFPETRLRKKVIAEGIAKHDKQLSTIKQQETAGTRLLRAIENFIACEEWQKKDREVKRYELTGLKELQLVDEFSRGLEKEMLLLDQCTEPGVDTFLEKHLLTELSFNGFHARLDRSRHIDIMPVIHSLDVFHAIKKLRYLCEALNRKLVYGIRHGEEHAPALLKTLEPYANKQYPYVYLFVNVYHMMAADSYAECYLYYQLIRQYAEHQTEVADSLREAIGYAISTALEWYNKGYDETGSEYLWWMEWRMKHNLFLDNGKLMPVTFRNVITIAISSKKGAAWIGKFIDAYSNCLPGENRETFLLFAQGLHQYSLKQYKEAIRYLMKARAGEEVAFNCMIRRWQWMCEYECDPNDVDSLSNQLMSFDRYLKRHKDKLEHRQATFYPFIGYAMKLLKTADSEMLQHRLHTLKNTGHFTGKPWLMQVFSEKAKPATHRAQRVELQKA